MQIHTHDPLSSNSNDSFSDGMRSPSYDTVDRAESSINIGTSNKNTSKK